MVCVEEKCWPEYKMAWKLRYEEQLRESSICFQKKRKGRKMSLCLKFYHVEN